ncbi:hypothetical protein V1504DRAFT_451471 [Lipomyces starkeyi]
MSQRKVECEDKNIVSYALQACYAVLHLFCPFATQRPARRESKRNFSSPAAEANAIQSVRLYRSSSVYTGEFIWLPGLLPSEAIADCTDFYFTRLHSTMPTLNLHGSRKTGF